MVLENKNAGVNELKFTYLTQPLVLEIENAVVKELKYHLFKQFFYA